MKIPRTLFQRGTALLLALIMCLSMLPSPALAAEITLADQTTPAGIGDVKPEVVMTDGGRTATVTYDRPGVKTDLHVICLVDTSIDNPEAAGIMSQTILPACEELRSGGLTGTAAHTITYQNTVQVLEDASSTYAYKKQLIGGFSFGSGQSNETAALAKALELIQKTDKTPVVFWVPAPATLVDSSYELESSIKPELAKVQQALKAKGGELIVWQMGSEASAWITGDNTHANYASSENFQAKVQESLAAAVRDYIKNFSLTLNLDTQGGLAKSITGVTVYDVRRDSNGKITTRYPIEGTTTEVSANKDSVTVSIPDLPDWMELEISLTVALDPDLKTQNFDLQDIVSAATATGTHYTGIFDNVIDPPSFQAAQLERKKLEKKTATFTFNTGDVVTGTAITKEEYPGTPVLIDISGWDAGNKTFSGWLTENGAFYKPGEPIRMRSRT